jgi:hypothetical protein
MLTHIPNLQDAPLHPRPAICSTSPVYAPLPKLFTGYLLVSPWWLPLASEDILYQQHRIDETLRSTQHPWCPMASLLRLLLSSAASRFSAKAYQG